MFSFDNKVTVELGEAENQVVHYVSVGSNDAPMFLPNRLNANIGDQVKFRFHNVNHTLTQSSLAEPCSSIGEFDTGFNQFNPEDKNNLVITLTVNSLNPQWFFCKQSQPSPHCHAGMVFALNPGDRMDAFLQKCAEEHQ